MKVNDHFVPRLGGHAVRPGWPPPDRRPRAVVWYALPEGDLRCCRRRYGGNLAIYRGRCAYHYAIGPSAGGGIDVEVDRYVRLGDRAVRPMLGQWLRWDGHRALSSRHDDATQTTIAVGLVVPDYSCCLAAGGPPAAGWIRAADADGREWNVREISPPQVRTAVEVGREIVRRWPWILPEHHLGEADLAPGVAGIVPSHALPLAEILRGTYADVGTDVGTEIPDPWAACRTVAQRLDALRRLGYDVGETWDGAAVGALRVYQSQARVYSDGYWTTFVSWAMERGARC